MTKLLLYIPGNLSKGGIRELKEFFKKIAKKNYELTVFSQGKYISIFDDDTKHILASSFRVVNEIRLKNYSSSFDNIICFSNLPSLFKLNCSQFVLIQNRYLIEKKLPNNLGFIFFFKMLIQRLFLRYFMRDSSFIVQTLTMVFYLKRFGIDDEKILLINYELLNNPISFSDSEKETTFFYPTSLDPHKNIQCLISAWNILSLSNIKARLEITITEDYLYKLNKDYANLNITPTGFLSEEDVSSKIKNCDYLIYPSLIESYGYNLKDAEVLAKNIISSESSYVYDVCQPINTFDPSCEFSIARSVARTLGSEEVFLKNYFKGIKSLAF